MSRERLEPGTWGEFTYSTRTTGGAVRHVVRCHYRDPYGRYTQPQATADTKTKARSTLQARLQTKPVASTSAVSPSSPFSALIAERLNHVRANTRLKDSTKNAYSKTLTNVLLPTFGGLTIAEIRTPLLESKIQEWIAQGQLPRARDARLQLKACFRLGAQLGITDVNPAQETTPVQRTQPQPHALTSEEVSRLRKAAADYDATTRPGRVNLNPISDVVDVFLMTGCRTGEALALRYQDIDFINCRVSINGTISEQTGQRQNETKSPAGKRDFDVPPQLMETLRRRRDTQPENNPNDAVFVTHAGTWVLPCNMRAAWRRVRKQADLDWVEPRNLRVTVGTKVANTISPAAAAQLLGHADETITRKHYMDKSHEARPQVADALAALAQKE